MHASPPSHALTPLFCSGLALGSGRGLKIVLLRALAHDPAVAVQGGKVVELTKVGRVAWSPTGAMIALAGGTGGREVLLFSALHRTLLARLTGHYSNVQVRLVPGGHRLQP